MSRKVPTTEQQPIIDCKINRIVLAKPGSGKTFTLSYIIKKELSNMPDYKGVIAISFTNKASRELKERSLSGGINPKSSFFGTIDKFFAIEIVFAFLPHIWGKSNNALDFKELDEIEDLNILTETDYQSLINFQSKETVDINDNISNILKKLYVDGIIPLEYNGKLANFVYDNSQVLKKYLKAKYTHIIIDEYQDSDFEQHRLFSKLAELGLVAIAVGDNDQAIYKFTKKDPRFLLELSRNTNFQLFNIDLNHRCHKSIINYSLHLMNESANLYSNDEIRVFYYRLGGYEDNIANWIDENIEEIKSKFDISKNSDIGILTRSNNNCDKISQNLNTNHKLYFSTPLDTDSSIFSTIFSDLLYFIFDKNLTKTEIIERYLSDSLDNQRKTRKIISLLNEIQKVADINLSNLINCQNKFIEIAETFQPKIINAAQKQLLTEVLSKTNTLKFYMPPDDDQLQVMTLHKSKGLEFDAVFHLDMYDWIIPGFNSIKDIERGNNEEMIQCLNLHYVGLTRAKKTCYLINTEQRRNSTNEIKRGTPSRFLNRHRLNELRHNFDLVYASKGN